MERARLGACELALALTFIAQCVSLASSQDSQPCKHPVSESEERDCTFSSERYVSVLLTDLFGTTDQKNNGTAPYDKTTRPVLDQSQVLNVSVTILVSKIVELDGAREEMQSNVRFAVTWTDEFLRWDPDKYGGVQQVSLSGEKPYFAPPTTFWNSVDPYETMWGSGDWIGTISSDGGVLESRSATVTTSCDQNVEHFPFDAQTCYIEVMSYNYPTDQLMYLAHTNTDASSLKSSSWNITYLGAEATFICWNSMGSVKTTSLQDSKSQLRAATQSTLGDAYFEYCLSGFQIKLEVKRYYESYLHMSCIPVAITVAITFVTFMLPVGGGERTGLIITSLLTVVAIMFITAEKVPETDDMTVLDKFYKAMILINLCVMIECATVSLLDTYSIHVDIRRLNLHPLFPEVWKSTWQSIRSRNHISDQHENGVTTIEENSSINADTEVPSFKGLKRIKALAKAEDQRKLYNLLLDLKMPECFDSLVAQDLDDIKILEHFTPLILLEKCEGFTLGKAHVLLEAVKYNVKVDNIVPLGDVVDRMCLTIFPVIWIACLQGVLGDYIDIHRILFGLLW
ncbi:hypothetical protein CYMTET_43005 [Cymbomonas tetramitiformis]|uniref:Uncharacterized protein n=1 Tax=Cymbomonas tetramitiformis TaxID=36881 RepID=A0AAE0C4X6_9CHLO|nr:hypothetical protein CYMTET_43005 [Cymbomonas tetramitiformis]